MSFEEILVEKKRLSRQRENKAFLHGKDVIALLITFSPCSLSEKKIRFDHYLVPNSLVELSLLYVDQGRRDEAIKLLHKAK